MADDFSNKIKSFKSKLPKEVANDSAMKKALADIEKTIGKSGSDYSDKMDKLLSALTKAKKNVSKDKAGKKVVEEMEKAAKIDKQKRMSFTDKSTSP